MQGMGKRLHRSEKNKALGGVCGGLGEYWDIDPVILRLAFVGLALATGIIPGVIFYILALFIVPREPHHS